MARYFARFGELRTILGADKAKNGKRLSDRVAFLPSDRQEAPGGLLPQGERSKVPDLYRRYGGRPRTWITAPKQIDGFKLHAFFPDDASGKAVPGQRLEDRL